MSAPTSCIRWFCEFSLVDLPLVGGKNASLGEMFQRLVPLGVRIPDGFAITAEAYREALDQSDAWVELHRVLDRLDKRDVAALARAGARAREIVYGAPMPHHVETTIRQAWREMKARFGDDLSVAVRSSATDKRQVIDSALEKVNSALHTHVCPPLSPHNSISKGI